MEIVFMARLLNFCTLLKTTYTTHWIYVQLAKMSYLYLIILNLFLKWKLATHPRLT